MCPRASEHECVCECVSVSERVCVRVLASMSVRSSVCEYNCIFSHLHVLSETVLMFMFTYWQIMLFGHITPVRMVACRLMVYQIFV